MAFEIIKLTYLLTYLLTIHAVTRSRGTFYFTDENTVIALCTIFSYKWFEINTRKRTLTPTLFYNQNQNRRPYFSSSHKRIKSKVIFDAPGDLNLKITDETIFLILHSSFFIPLPMSCCA